jgi:ribonuclease-3
MLNNIIGRIKLPFRKEKELYLSLYKITGQYPRNIQYYKVAFVHKSVARRTLKGKPLNNERLEFLGDAILDAIVGDIVFKHFPGKKEGFLTNTRSKLVQRSTLNRIANEMGIMRFLKWSGSTVSHNNYLGGNTFEALVGALYLDHGYDACMKFMKKRILGELINIEKVAYKEINFKSKLLEWAQKNRINLQYRLLEEKTDEKSNPIFHYQVVLENITGCDATGFSKKESQQLASKLTLEKLKKNASFLDSVFAAKTQRTKMEEEPIMMVPDIEPVPFVRESTTEPAEKPKAAVQEEDEFDLSNISHQKKTAAEIIAAAENAAYAAI